VTLIIFSIPPTLLYIFKLDEVKLAKEAAALEVEYQEMKLKERYTHRLSDYITCWKDWLKEPCFYIYGMVFMFVRAGLQYILSI